MTWIFGYASLMWRPAFPHDFSRRALIRGWRRRLWQGSPDHRGTGQQPGRVATLVAEPQAYCEGLAFAVNSDALESVLRKLDERESGGYVRLDVRCEFDDRTTAPAITYYAPPANANFLGPAPIENLIAQVRRSTGQSGSNVDYVLRLAASLKTHNMGDDDVFAIARRLNV